MLSVKRIAGILIEYRQRITLVLFIAYYLFIIYYTLLCRQVGAEHTADLRFMWAYREMLTWDPEWKEDVRYNVLNILFFIPFGLWFPESVTSPAVFKNKRWMYILSVGMLFSVLIETTQYLTCRGLCELDDVLCNGLGSLIGYWILLLLKSVWANTQRKINIVFKELDE